MDVPTGDQVSGWLLGAVATIAAAGVAWKRFSADKLDVAKSSGEGGWITKVVKERDDALARERTAVDRQLADARTIAGLELRNALLLERLERMEKQIELIRRLLVAERPDLADLLANSAFGSFSPAATDPKGRP